MKRTLYAHILALAAMLAFTARAQQTPVVISNGTIHVGNGEVIENGYLVMLGGKIVSCGKEMNTLYKTARFIDARGKHIYPGLICLSTCLGLNEIDAVRATHDYAEAGNVNPDAHALFAYNTDSKVTPTARFNGIMLVQAVPQGGLVSGQSSIMKTEGWNWEDAQYKADDGIHFNWPEPYVQTGWWAEPGDTYKQRTAQALATLEDLFAEARRYNRIDKPEAVNLRLASMKGLFDGSKKAYVYVNSAKGILSALVFFKKYPSINVVLVGAADAAQVIDAIRESKVPVVLNKLHRLPQKGFEDVDLPYRLPALLMKAGIKVAIGHEGSWEARNLMFNAGTAAAYGLSKEEALMCITRNAADIAGIGTRAGTLETGKDALVIISSGDVLDMRSNNIEHAFINGEEVSLSSTQQQLERKYLDKYGIK